jgi:Leucine-rich repeat (LRR) protein
MKTLLCRTCSVCLMLAIVFCVFPQSVHAETIHPLRTYDCTSQTQISELECLALVAMYNSTGGDAWTNHTGWLQTTTPCSWFGVSCLGNAISALQLPNNNLTGPIPPEMGNFSVMYGLFLYGNQLTGAIPPEMGNLSTLNYLYLDSNELTGTIPPELGNLSALVDLYLYDNHLSGTLPPELGNLSALEWLYLSNNPSLTGEIPLSFTNLTSLQVFYFSNTGLCEPFTPEFRAWKASVASWDGTRACNSIYVPLVLR